MDWLAERRRMFSSSKISVKSFEDFISKSSVVNTFYAYSSNVTVNVDTENCTKYVITLSVKGTNVNGLGGSSSIVRITNGVVTELFSYIPSRYGSEIIPTASSTSSILFGTSCLGIVIDPLNLNIVSCDELLRSAIHIASDLKDSGEGATACIQQPFSKGAKYVIAAWELNAVSHTKHGAKIVRVDSNISFTELASSGYVTKLLSGVHTDNSNHGFWYVYSYNETYVGIANDRYNEHIVALSFDE